MKILHITQNYYPSVGGTQHTIKRISEYFHSQLHDDVLVLTTNSLYGPNRPVVKKVGPAEEIINGVKVKRVPFVHFHNRLIRIAGKISYRLFKAPLPGFLISLYTGPVSPAMQKEIDLSDADVIGASSIDYLFADYPIKRLHRKRPKPFVMYGALHLHTNKVPPYYKARIKAADYYIANTIYEKQAIVNMGFDEDKVVVVGAGSDIYTKADFSITDAQLQKNYSIPAGNIVITYIGRQEVVKGIPVLLEAVNKLKETFSNITLLICGAAGGYTQQLQNLALSNNSIKVFTNISDLQKTEVLRITDVLVLPSKEESFGVVFLEAWSFSKPVIGAGIGAVASLVEDGKDGLLFNVDDADSLAEKLSILIQDKSLREQMGVEGNKKFRENYTWDIIAEKFRAVYQLAINKFKTQQHS